MKIIKKDLYKLGEDELIADNVKEVDACLICHLLNNNIENDYTYYYEVIPDNFIAEE